MSNYHVEPVDKPGRPDQGGHQVAAQAAGPGPVAPPADAGRARRPASGCGCSRSPPARSASPGRTSRAASGRRSRSATSTRSSSRTRRCRSTKASRPTTRRRAPSSSSYDPGQQQFIAGRGHDRRRHGAQRPGALPALPAPRLQAEPVPQELLVRVSVPRLALRPARDQGRRRPVRPGAAEHGPLLDHRRRGRRADHQHRQDHARPAAGRARPARASSRRARRPGCI